MAAAVVGPLAATSAAAAAAAAVVLGLGAALALELGDGPAAPILYAVPGFVVPTALLAGPAQLTLGSAWLPGLVGALATAAIVSSVRASLHELWAPVSLDWRGRLASGLARGCFAIGTLLLPLAEGMRSAGAGALASTPFVLAFALACVALAGDRRRLRFLRLVATDKHPSKRLVELASLRTSVSLAELAGLTVASSGGGLVLVHAEAHGAGAFRAGEASVPLALASPAGDEQILGQRMVTMALTAIGATLAVAVLVSR
ncbi:MAG: hypothetical protein AAGH15_07955 [Myxococcota bacterium]